MLFENVVNKRTLVRYAYVHAGYPHKSDVNVAPQTIKMHYKLTVIIKAHSYFNSRMQCVARATPKVSNVATEYTI